MDEGTAAARGRRVRVAGYTIGRLDEGAYRWEVEARGLGVLRHSLFKALVDHTAVAGLPLYRIPGYGLVYPAAQRWLHAHGRCVLSRKRYGDPDGATVWGCSWCGHRVTERPSHQALLDLRRRLSAPP